MSKPSNYIYFWYKGADYELCMDCCQHCLTVGRKDARKKRCHRRNEENLIFLLPPFNCPDRLMQKFPFNLSILFPFVYFRFGFGFAFVLVRLDSVAWVELVEVDGAIRLPADSTFNMRTHTHTHCVLNCCKTSLSTVRHNYSFDIPSSDDMKCTQV